MAVVVASTALPAVFVVWFAVEHGGYRSGTSGLAAAITAALLVLRIVVAPSSFRMPSRAACVALVTLAGAACWTAASMLWSGAESPAVADLSRLVLYLLVALSLATLPTGAGLWVVYASTVAVTAVTLIALLSRTAPSVVPTLPEAGDARLLYPIGYWNALAFMIASSWLLHLHLSCDLRERMAVRAISTALLPAIGAALFLTQSRGGILTAAVGTATYLVVAKPRGAVATLAAATVPVAAALFVSYSAAELITPAWRSPDGVREGTTLLVVVCVVGVLGAAARVAFAPLDDRATRIVVSRTVRRVAVSTLLVGVVSGSAAGVALGVPARFERAFLDAGPSDPWGDPTSRLTDVYSNGRAELWSVAWRQFERRPLTGEGAGSFSTAWARDRENFSSALDAHSLYVETLGELGLVGVLLVGSFVVALLAMTLAVVRTNPAAAVAVALVAAWCVEVAIEWAWEIPAATLPVLAIAFAASSRPNARPFPRGARRVVAATCVVAACVPAAEFAGQARTDDAIAAYNRADCAAAVRVATSAAGIAPWQDGPHTVQALCAARARERETALAAMRRAEGRRPGDWRLAYDRAIVEATTGGDPRPAMVRASAANYRQRDVRYLLFAALHTDRAAQPRTFGGAFTYIAGFPEMPLGPGESCAGDDNGYWRWTTWTQQHCRPSTGPARWTTPTRRPLTPLEPGDRG